MTRGEDIQTTMVLKISCQWALMYGVQPGSRLVGRLGVWWRGGRGFGHQSLFCLLLIRCPSGNGGLFELYGPLIIHLGRSRLGQAHKDLIYTSAGNEGTWRCRIESWDCWPSCQEIEVMDGTHCDLTHPSKSSSDLLLYFFSFCTLFASLLDLLLSSCTSRKVLFVFCCLTIWQL